MASVRAVGQVKMVAVDPAAFCDDENWSGGFYELAVLLGERDDARLDAALCAVWSDGHVDGCYPSRDREPAEQERVPCSLASLGESGHLRGTATLPSGRRVVCGAVVIREDESRRDWLDFYLPLGALSVADHRVGGFAGEGGVDTLAWRAPIDEWFADIGVSVYRSAPFVYALIGFEVSGEDLPPSGVAERYIATLVPANGTVEYRAATR